LAGKAPRLTNSKEADVIEANEPVTATSENAKPPESDLVRTAREAGAAAQERVSGVRDAAKSTLDEAKSTATEKAEETKDLAAGELARTAEGLHAAADKMEGSPFQQDLLREAAGGLRQIAEAVEGKSIGTLAGDLSEFGRQNPIAFLGGAALVGFALARFARASTPVGTTAVSRFGAGSADRSGDQDRAGTDLASADFAGESDHG
jgi:hypothetical protein